MSYSRRPVDALLTLLDVSRWVQAPQLGLDSLRTVGRIEVEALQTLASLVDLVGTLPQGKPLAEDAVVVHQLIADAAAGNAIDEAVIERCQQWLADVTLVLRTTKRSDFQHGLNQLIRLAEARSITERLAI